MEAQESRPSDTGTLQYELYMSSDNTECVVFERYRDSQALLDHFDHMGETMAAIFETCTGSGEVCGRPKYFLPSSPALLDGRRPQDDKRSSVSGLRAVSGGFSDRGRNRSPAAKR